MIDLAISFDATGSMSPCISEVKRKVIELVNTLSKQIAGIRFSIIIHGDYCDPDVISVLDFTDNPKEIHKFIDTRRQTGGGDAPECYELSLENACTLDWKNDRRAFIMLGDEVPHEVGYRYGRYTAKDWRVYVERLQDKGVVIYGVQCLNNRGSSKFYEQISKCNNGSKLDLHQFSNISELICAVSYKQADRLEEYQDQLIASGFMNRSLNDMFEKLSGKKSKVTFEKSALEPVHPARFQILHVDTNCVIKDFVEDSGAVFKKGRGFYQFTKKETVQERKEVVLRDKKTGDLFSGKEARELIGLPYGERADLRPAHLEKYDIFIQSTSSNRKLMKDTLFLYEA